MIRCKSGSENVFKKAANVQTKKCKCLILEFEVFLDTISSHLT